MNRPFTPDRNAGMCKRHEVMIIKVLTIKNRPSRNAIRLKALVPRFIQLFILTVTLSWTLAGCQNPDFIWELILPTTSAVITDATGETETVSGSESGLTEDLSSIEATQTAVSVTTAQETSPTSSRQELVLPDDLFDKQVGDLILTALQSRQRTIVLDDVFQTYLVDDAMVQAAINAIFAIYDDVFTKHPEFFYMSGSFEVSYTLMQGSRTSVSAMKLIPGFWEDTEQLTDEQLDELIDQVMREVRLIADQIRQQTSEPIEQAILLHDWLIQRIAYDPQADQANNTVHSALLDGITLCSGYARSFQLTGLELGLEVDLITGQSGGIGHAWNLIDLSGSIYHIDVTHDDPLPDQGEDGPIDHRHLFRSDAQMSQTHQWQRLEYPACPEDGAFYYTRNGLVVTSRKELTNRLDDFLDEIDFSNQTSNRLELLYTGDDVPSTEQLQKLFADALREADTGSSVVYRSDAEKSVLVMEVTPQS